MADVLTPLPWKMVLPGTHAVELAPGHVYAVTRAEDGWLVKLKVGKKEETIATARLLWLGKCRAEQHYANLRSAAPSVNELATKLPRQAKAKVEAKADKSPGEGPRRRRRKAGDTAAASQGRKAERPPPNKSITLDLDNQDREDDVLVTASGDRADLWARHQGTLAGSRWEVAEGALPYVVVTDSPTLVADLKKEVPGAKINTDQYQPPSPKAPPEEPPKGPHGKGGLLTLEWEQQKSDKRDVYVASHAGADFKILRVNGTDGFALFKQKGDVVQEVTCASLDDCKAKAQELVGKAGRKPRSEPKAGPAKPRAAKKSAEAAKKPEGEACGCAVKPAEQPKAAPPMDDRAKAAMAMEALADILARTPPPAA